MLAKTKKSGFQEKLLFLYRFLQTPGQIGSVTPSSKFLAKKMVDAVPWNEVYSVAELGAGTGAITKYIHAAKRIHTRVLLFEKDTHLRKELQKQYRNFSCYEDCQELQTVLKLEELSHVDCIISGLPFYNFPQAIRDKLVEQIIESLKDEGWFIAFQYSKQMKKQLEEHFDVIDIQFVPLNVPPAFVYVCKKKKSVERS
ncbi:SAM-dependent methyltransferase [Paenibacillus baekrokdamisoli]|uniref:SAM-dependent methyltransferase n=1 Tax=Paenibacillus baekrokdamisoli TaxID=1712516 RepID=A0A3G9ITU0_9BACL|nr:rRNA adenine N-6-methyltransferase family protein [Paenibacillus baekrokdamisoli]MBB3071245.1 phospholipid N-methyltransferase [Paenibacillus baekrokdamisoli]BBH21662.1 SAM-dependent methyltransferase [Paenibacillus baekrokdamisoli]